MNIEALVEQYIKVRDRIEALKAKHKAELEPFEAVLEKIEGVMLEHFQTTGQESAKTAAGTAYRQKQTSATVADRPAFMQWLQDTNRWDCADVRAGKTAITEYIDEHEAPPPGINYSARYKVNFRRS